MKRLASGALLGLTVVLLAPPASAQLNSIPVYFSPKGGSGFTIAADFGRGLNDESGKNTALAFRAALGISAFSVGGGVGIVNPRAAVQLARNNEVQYAGNIALRVVGGALIPIAVSVQGGVGFVKRDTLVGPSIVEQKELNIPIGIGIGLNVPTPAFSFEPWAAPRLSVTRVQRSGNSQTQTGFGISAGFNLAFVMGLGVHVGFDWETLPSVTSGSLNLLQSKPATLGIGLHYTFRLPGLPGVPLM